MKARALWKLSVQTTPEAEEAVAELLAGLFAQPACIQTDLETHVTSVAVYLESRAAWSKSSARTLRAGLGHIGACGLDVGAARVGFDRVRREDWAESWKRHFKPFVAGGRLLVKPSWSRRHPARGAAVVVLDPGLSFGTGQHPTTRFCLEQLVVARKPDIPQSFLDIGTGSGILAIAAAKIGYRPVEGFDCDPDAVRIARTNAVANRVGSVFHPTCADLLRVGVRNIRKYDVVCANLVPALLIEARKRVLARLKQGGVLIVAGILTDQFAAVRAAYERSGSSLVASGEQSRWKSGTFIVEAGPGRTD